LVVNVDCRVTVLPAGPVWDTVELNVRGARAAGAAATALSKVAAHNTGRIAAPVSLRTNSRFLLMAIS
jgi:hypothetical protein